MTTPTPAGRRTSGRAARRAAASGRALVPLAAGRGAESGQATIEVVALLPVVLVVGLAAAAVVAGHGAREQAGQAAQAGAMAFLQGGEPRAAARRALPAGVRDRAAIEIRGRRVTVRVRPALPAPVAAAMTAEVSADAGPEAAS